jgi:hypothetical protein
MNKLLSAILILLTVAVSVPAQYAQPTATYATGTGSPGLVPGAANYTIVQQGPDSRIWSRVDLFTNELGVVSMQTNSYVELQTGMCYLTNGQYLPSQEVIVGYPGGAVATQGQIQMIFPNDLSAEPVDAQTTAGLFRSSVLTLSYADSALQTNILLAELHSCQGSIISPNQVLYPGALVGEGAVSSVRYTYRKYGYEQDILVNPDTMALPEDYGLSNQSPTLSIEVISEFFAPPSPSALSRSMTTRDGTMFHDDDLDWGAMRLGQGQAIFIGQSGIPKTVPTTKRWVVTSDNRHFLVEDVPFSLLKKALLSSGGASVLPRQRSVRHLASLSELPKHRPAKPPGLDSKPMEVALDVPPERGLVIDYVTMSSSATNYVFQCDSTYYVSGLVSLSQTTTFEGGAVIKFTNYPTAKVSMSGPLVLKAGQYRPVVMTSKDDNTVGSNIGGSTGSPSNTNGATYLEDNNNQNNAYQNLRMLYAGAGLSAANFSNGVWHSQFVNCGTAVNASGSGPVALRNVLISQCTNAVVTTGTLTAEHLTADQCTTLLSGAGSSGNVTNSLITAVSAVTNVTLYYSAKLTSGAGVYQTAGYGNYYLADGSTNRNAGTTNINAQLLADLQKRTTSPPIVWAQRALGPSDLALSPQAQRDTDTPDLGFHMDPIDYLLGYIYTTNAITVTVNAGTVIGGFGTNNNAYALKMVSNASLNCQGTPAAPVRIVAASTVQEQPATNWLKTTSGLINDGGTFGVNFMNFRFTDWSSLEQDGYVLSAALLANLQDSQFHGGKLQNIYSGFNFTNCLFERVNIDIAQDPGGPLNFYRNNTFYGGRFNFSFPFPSNVTLKDNLFDKTSIPSSVGSGYAGGFNAFVTNYNRLSPTFASDIVLSASPSYQAGPLENFYLLSSSVLVNADTNTTADQVGLYQYTVCTNLLSGAQIKETNSFLDIGYHAVATDSSGNPLDSNGDGTPDYLSDSNGNGLVDSGEVGWNLTGDLGLKVIITRPRNNAVIP